MHMLILDSFKAAAPKPSVSLRFVANAAGPLLHAIAEEMRDTYTAAAGHFVSVMPSYGMTECMPIASPPVGFNLEKPGSSGQIVGPRCQIQDDEGIEKPLGEVGHIMVKGHPVMHHFWQQVRDLPSIEALLLGLLTLTCGPLSAARRAALLKGPSACRAASRLCIQSAWVRCR